MLRYLLFDLDNTLYPSSTRMENDILRRMGEFAGAWLGTSPRKAMALRREGAFAYGTTLEWLMAEHGFTDPEAFFAAVHPAGEEYCIEPDPLLGPLLDSMPLPKAIFTNSPREHAERVVAKLGVEDRFEAIYDIRFCDLHGKPKAEAFRRVCEACGFAPEEMLFIDDLPRYVEGFVALGGRGVLVDELDRHQESKLTRIRSLAELPSVIAL